MHRSKRSPSGPCSVCSWLPRAGLSNRPQRRSTAVATRSWLWRQSRPRRDLLRPKFCLMAHILRIVAFEPQPGEEVGTDTTLTWTFSEPMDQQSVERALRLLPETSGRFTWVSDHVVAFSPDELVRGQRYTVSFAADVRSVAGLPLSGNPEYAFHTLSTLQVTR